MFSIKLKTERIKVLITKRQMKITQFFCVFLFLTVLFGKSRYMQILKYHFPVANK